MKLTRLLAMLLALCMILCCFAACGSSDEDDEDENEKVEDKEKDEDEDEDKSDKDDKDEDDEASLVGKWGMIFDFSARAAEEELWEKYGGDTPLPPLSFVFEWDFAEDGNLTVTAIEFPINAEATRFYEVLLAYRAQELTADEIDELLDRSGYSNLEDYIAETAVDRAVDFVNAARDNAVIIEETYEVDGNVITLGDGTEIEYNIFRDEMTFEKVKGESNMYAMFEAHALHKQ